MNGWEFAGEHPWAAFFLALLAAGALKSVCGTVAVLWNRTLRHWNIRKHGYPPAHCDADGDFAPLKGGE